MLSSLIFFSVNNIIPTICLKEVLGLDKRRTLEFPVQIIFQLNRLTNNSDSDLKVIWGILSESYFKVLKDRFWLDPADSGLSYDWLHVGRRVRRVNLYWLLPKLSELQINVPELQTHCEYNFHCVHHTRISFTRPGYLASHKAINLESIH